MSSRVAVTGADGFIGSHLVELLVSRGDTVRAMVQYNSVGTWGWLDTLDKSTMDSVEVLPGDVRDPACVRDLVTGAEVVYHLAALIAIPYSYRAPRSYVETNVLGTLNVLDAVRAETVPRLVHTSTSETYGTARTVPIDERHPNQTQSPYAVIPTMVSQLAAGADEILLGALDPTRDFTFVADTARAFVAVGTAPAADVVGRLLNAGTGEEVSIGALARLIGRQMGRDVPVRQDPARLRPEGSEVMRLVCDSGELRRITGWRPGYALTDGLKPTIEWFLEPDNLARYRPGTYTL
jgi:nucleoside-diphosphate-sugar epimerase